MPFFFASAYGKGSIWLAILGGTLVTVPLRVQGPFKDPKVIPLPPSAIGEGLLGIMKRTLELPFEVIDDVTPKGRSAGTPSVP